MRRFFFYLAAAGVAAILIAMLLSAHTYSGPSKMSITQSRAKALGIGMIIYKDEFEKYPTGDNAAIMKTLLGDNSKKELFVRLDGRQPNAINENGQCVDGLGTPFQIDVTSTNRFVIRSAGINKIFGDKDDVVFNASGFIQP